MGMKNAELRKNKKYRSEDGVKVTEVVMSFAFVTSISSSLARVSRVQSINCESFGEP